MIGVDAGIDSRIQRVRVRLIESTLLDVLCSITRLCDLASSLAAGLAVDREG